MALSRAALDEALAKVNEAKKAHERASVAAFAPSRFTLAFPDVPQPDGRCIDEDFAAVQFALKETANVDTGIIGARLDEKDTARYLVEYEVIEW